MPGRVVSVGAVAMAVACTGPRSTSGAGTGAPAIDATATDAMSAMSDAGVADASAVTLPPTVLHVPRARAPITPTGHFRVELWDGAPSTRTLLDRAGKGAVPVSEGRFLWRDRTLYFFFYAGDLDLQAHVARHDGPIWNDDSVELAFGDASDKRHVVRISVTGVISDGLCPGDAVDLSDPRCDLRWESGARAATDYDGKLNDIADRDEEWAVEAALPLGPLGVAKAAREAAANGTVGRGAATVPVRVRRCEIAHDGPRACGAWEGTLVLEE